MGYQLIYDKEHVINITDDINPDDVNQIKFDLSKPFNSFSEILLQNKLDFKMFNQVLSSAKNIEAIEEEHKTKDLINYQTLFTKMILVGIKSRNQFDIFNDMTYERKLEIIDNYKLYRSMYVYTNNVKMSRESNFEIKNKFQFDYDISRTKIKIVECLKYEVYKNTTLAYWLVDNREHINNILKDEKKPNQIGLLKKYIDELPTTYETSMM